jgi:nitrogen fixation/metabolism regulation signal transduction histidine kinase
VRLSTTRPIWTQPTWRSRWERVTAELRKFRLRTMRGRLLVGFGATLGALLVSGIVSLYAIERIYDEMRSSVDNANSVSTTLFQAYDATLRYVATAQATLLDNRLERVAQAESLSTMADSLRRVLLTSSHLDTKDRRALEELGAIQGHLEVRFAVARAYRDVGLSELAARQAVTATGMLDSLFQRAAHLTRAQDARSAEALRSIKSTAWTRRATLLVLLLIGLVLSIALGVWTWRAITRPLDRLTSAAASLGDGDLRVSVPSLGMDDEYLLLATTFTRMAERLRSVVTDIQREEVRLVRHRLNGAREPDDFAERDLERIHFALRSVDHAFRAIEYFECLQNAGACTQ